MTDAEIQLPGYLVTRKDHNRNGGGVCLYTRTDLAFSLRFDLEQDSLEATWVDILFPKTKPILVGVCYRPPNDYSFYGKLEDVLTNVTVSWRNIIILG